MKAQLRRTKKTNTIWYRFKRYPSATLLSFGLVIVLVSILWYYIGLLYPKFRLFDGLLSETGLQENVNYNFYSGQQGLAYDAIGQCIHGRFGSNGDSIINIQTSGGSENGMKLTAEKKSFGLIQEEIINHEDQLRKNVRIVAPLFLERMHIFYRKDMFGGDHKGMALSANLDNYILKCLSDSSIKVNMGVVGSGTRIIASYIMALIEKQINHRLKKNASKFTQISEPFSESFTKMISYNEKTDSQVDILFYMGADPNQKINELLNLNKYRLMSIDPSFVMLLNKEFGLALRVADFKGKYNSTNDITSLATFTYLIASKAIHEDVVYKLLKKINNYKDSIYCSLMPDSQPDKSSTLFEFGFFNVFDDEYGTSLNQWMKEVFVFFLSIITLFFPVFKSVIGLRFILQRWNINKKIDEVVADCGDTAEDYMAARSGIARLKEKVIDMYGDGLLPEMHYNPLMKRIELYFKKFTTKSMSPENGSLVIIDRGNKPVQV